MLVPYKKPCMHSDSVLFKTILDNFYSSHPVPTNDSIQTAKQFDVASFHPSIQGASHVDLTLDIFFRILLLRHDKANLEVLWPSHMLKLS